MTRALAAAFFLLYAWCAAPGVEWLDAGELVTAGWTLGVSHPPGQPGYSMLAKAATLLPFGEIAWRVNLLSALCGALAVAGAFSLARVLVGKDDLATRVGAGFGAVIVGLAPIVVEQATRAEVYAPASALCVWGTTFALRARGLRTSDRGPRTARDVLVAALLFALCVSVHPLVAAAAGLPIAVMVAWALRRRVLRVGPWAVGLAVLGLLVLAYLPLRAAAPDRSMIVWGEPDSWARFKDVVTGAAYGGNFAGGGFGERVGGHLMLVAEGSGFALVVAGGLGLLFGALTRLRGAFALAAGVLVVIAAAAAQKVFHAPNPDVHGYLVPAALFLAPGIAVVLAAAARIVAATTWPGWVWFAAAIPVAALAAAGPTVHVRDGGARRGDDALVHWDLTVGRMPAGPAVFFANSDHLVFPAWYERFVAGARPDVAIANDALVKSSWFLRAMKRALPEVFVPFVDDGRADRLATRLVQTNLSRGVPVGGESWKVEARAVPNGLAFLYGDGAAPRPAPIRLYRGDIGRRVTGFVALLRKDAEALASSGKPPLWRELPSVTPVFIYEPWQGALAMDNPPADGPFEARLMRAWLELLAGRGDDGIAPLGPDARVMTARMLVSRGDPSGAEAQLRAAPDHEPAQLLLAALLGNAGRLDEAEQILRRYPSSPRALAQLGLVLAKTDRLPEAVTTWQESLRLDPDQPDVRAWLLQSQSR